jgi:hypothetical protein
MATITQRILKPYIQSAPVPTFLAGFFRTTPESYKNSEEVSYDTMREDEEVAVPVLGDESNHNDLGDFDNKFVVPPTYRESASISAKSLGKNRQIGETIYKDPVFQREAGDRVSMMLNRLEKKLRRGVSIQASQILTTAKLDLVGTDGVSRFLLDYKPKSALFPNAAVAWGSATLAQKLSHIETLCEAIRDTGLEDVKRLIFGQASFSNLIDTSGIENYLDLRRGERGEINRLTNGGTRGGQYRGSIDVGSYKLDIWTSGERYSHPQTGVKTKLVPDDKIIFLSDGLFETVFGRVFYLDNGQRPVISELARKRGKMLEQGLDMFLNNWIELNGSAATFEITSRPLLIPRAMDTFGCLDTGL